ncbi:MAG: type II toxin-antitoxin system RelE/ParE family toxin [Deltaproteobacteria bacterium]|nr:type II toxin-antitoxin system RelE/ParE family toxin [Deltaproteobacteria bacterium]
MQRCRRTPEACNAWWRENRPAAPALFADELEAALARMSAQPDSGRPMPRKNRPGLRRVEMPRTRYYVLYEHDAATHTVYVHAVWSALRGRGPRLTKP